MIIKISGQNDIRVSSLTDLTLSNVAKITDISTVADVSKSLNNTYLFLFAHNNSKVYCIYFDVNSEGIDPNINYTTSVEVNLSTNATANDVAAALQTEIHGLSEFSATVLGNVVTVTNGTAGGSTDPFQSVVHSPGLTFNITTPGSNSAPSALKLYKIVGTQGATEIENRDDFQPLFERTDITIIVPENQILEIIED